MNPFLAAMEKVVAAAVVAIGATDDFSQIGVRLYWGLREGIFSARAHRRRLRHARRQHIINTWRQG